MCKCILCSNEFEGRSNQKFCSSKCKNSYHNVRNKDKESHITNLNKTLRKNWLILNKLYDIYRSSPFSMQIAQAHGFVDKYHTHIHNSPRGDNYKMIYDIGYIKHLDGQIQIVQGDV